MDDLISRREAVANYQHVCITVKCGDCPFGIEDGEFTDCRLERFLLEFPSAQSDLITKIQNGIKVTDADDAYSCGMRNGMRWCISLIDDKEPLYENCPTAQPKQYMITMTESTDIDRLKGILARPSDITIIPLPTAQPERKKGKWIDRYNNGDWHCSICNAIVEKDEQTYRNWYYCYHCGADMTRGE